MANKTNFLGLILPANNEFSDTWDVPLNDNFIKVDEEIEVISNEVQAARFIKTSLAEFLDVSHFSDGTLKPSTEQDDARNSLIYGDDDGSGNDFILNNRLDLSEREVFNAREGLAALIDSLARRSKDFNYQDSTINGAKDINNQPNFLASSGAEFQLNGDPVPVEFNINGYYMKLDRDLNVLASGSDGTKYLVAKKPSAPFEVLDKSADESGITSTNTLNNDKIQIFVDITVDFPAIGSKAGHVLQILNSANAGEYIINQVNFEGNSSQILIIGRFKSAVGSVNYKILDPLRPEFSVENTYLPEDGKVILGEGSFISGALVSNLTYNFKRKYESPFTAVDVSTSTTFEVVLNHNLGTIPREIEIFASQANDESEPFEPLSFSLVGNDLSVNIDNTLVFSPGTFDPGTSDASYSPLPNLVGNVDGLLSGGVYDLRSVQIKVTRTQIFIKNVKNNHFYRDYDGTDKDAGFLKIICKK